MAYRLVFGEKADAVLMSLEAHHFAAVTKHLERLAESPAAISRPRVPFVFSSPCAMLSHYEGFGEGGIREQFVIFFDYSEDGTTLLIDDIAYWQLDANAPIREL